MNIPGLSGRKLSGIDRSLDHMTTFVLVPGFFLGGWAWRPVTDTLRAHGHDVYPLTLTGLAERSHLAAPTVDLGVHTDDVVNLLRWEDLHDVVLVGHSYGGLVTTNAADRVPERIGRLVYVDTGPLPDGAAQADFAGPEQAAQDRAVVDEQGDGWLLPAPPWTALAAGVEGVDEATLHRLAELGTPQPYATATAPMRLTGAWEKLPRYSITCSFTVAQIEALAASAPLFRHMAGDNWHHAELPTWHWPMFSRPADLAALLLAGS
jgi:pimeloyl-ACP methyl ester carboxylesterase